MLQTRLRQRAGMQELEGYALECGDEQTMKLKMKTSEVFEVILWAIMIVHLELPWWVWGIWLLTIFGVHIEYPKGDSE